MSVQLPPLKSLLCDAKNPWGETPFSLYVFQLVARQTW